METPPPAFSVLMAAHRDDRPLREALRSVDVALQGHDTELIVIANGAERERVADSVRHTVRHPRLQVESCVIASLGYCRNRAVELARGTYVATVDADDRCLPGRFAHQLALAQSTSADFIFGAARDIGADGSPLHRLRHSSTTLWNRCGPLHPTAFIRRQALLALGGYAHHGAGEDYALWLRAAAAGYSMHADAAAVVAYRLHAQQASARGRLAAIFANNAGAKLTLALHGGSPLLLVGAALDSARCLLRRCADACW